MFGDMRMRPDCFARFSLGVSLGFSSGFRV